jgi:transposase
VGAQGVHADDQAQLSLGEALDDSGDHAGRGDTLQGARWLDKERADSRVSGSAAPLHTRQTHRTSLGRLEDAHVHNATKRFLEEHEGRITAFRLPPYSPRFNPVEFLWAEIKWSRMRGFCPKNTNELKMKLYRCVGSLRRKTPLIRSYFDASDLPLGHNEETKLRRYQ